ncbi:MAG: hypothetical protein JKY81_01615 [Colwellia sp.]|nr:hypothetical protein [Colwellia sp.]
MTDTPYNGPITKRVFVKDILKQTAEVTGVPADVISGKIKTRIVVRARHKFFYDCVDKLELGCHRVGAIAGFNHATVMNGVDLHARRNDLPRVSNYDGIKHRAANLARYHDNKP